MKKGEFVSHEEMKGEEGLGEPDLDLARSKRSLLSFKLNRPTGKSLQEKGNEVKRISEGIVKRKRDYLSRGKALGLILKKWRLLQKRPVKGKVLSDVGRKKRSDKRTNPFQMKDKASFGLFPNDSSRSRRQHRIRQKANRRYKQLLKKRKAKEEKKGEDKVADNLFGPETNLFKEARIRREKQKKELEKQLFTQDLLRQLARRRRRIKQRVKRHTGRSVLNGKIQNLDEPKPKQYLKHPELSHVIIESL